MRKKYYDTVFEVTMTCQNGNERRVRKSVLSPMFRDGKHIDEGERIRKGTETLKKEQCYDIEYVMTKTKVLLFMDEA